MKKRPPKGPEFDNPPAAAASDQWDLEDLEEADVAYPEEEIEPVPHSEIERVKKKHEERLQAIDGVVGIGIGSNEIGDDVIMVYLRDEQSENSIPTELDGFPVKTEITGEIDAYDA